MKTHRPFAILTCLMAITAYSPNAKAALYAYEGFNGYSSGTLNGQTVSVNTVGLDTSTAITGGGSLTVNTFNSTGLTFSNLQVNGGSGRYTSSTGAASYIGFNYNGAAVAAGSTLYSSYVMNITSGRNNASSVGMRANATASTGGGSAFFSTFADTQNNSNTGIQYLTGLPATITSSSQALALGTSYIVVGRFTNVGNALTAEAPGIGTLFVLTEDQFANFQLGGFTDAELDAAAVGAGVNDVFSRVSQTVTSGTYSLAAGNGLQFGPGNGAVSTIVSYDEMRWGSGLGDVLPTIPEPATGVAMTFAVMMLLGLRRRSAGEV